MSISQTRLYTEPSTALSNGTVHMSGLDFNYVASKAALTITMTLVLCEYMVR
jgi:hypothetical protein